MGKNGWGVDVPYFKKELASLSRSLPNRTGAELYRYLLRLAAVAQPVKVDSTSDNSARAEISLLLLEANGKMISGDIVGASNCLVKVRGKLLP